MQAEGPPTEARGGNRGVLFVHGVGDQRKSDTLLDQGNPLFGWLWRWFRAFGSTVRVGRVELSFAPVDVGPADVPPWGRLELPGRRWSMAEVWWAASDRPPDLATMLGWSFRHLRDIIAQLWRNVLQRVDRLLHEDLTEHPTQPSRWWVAIDLATCIGLLVLYPLLAVVGYALLVPLLLVVQIPIDVVQQFVLLRVIRPLLTINAGEFRTMLDDELQAANIRRRLADAIDWLVDHEQCQDNVVIVAHSEGCVVSFGMLVDPEFKHQASHVRKLITLGAGLNKSWLLRPKLQRLHGPLDGDTLWVDVWASFDPVPAGPLSPPPGVQIYAPTGEAARQLGGSTTPISLQVTNTMNVLSDHGGYWANDEQVMVRIAAEIDAPDHAQSLFWAGDWNGAARQRRERVSVLALVRDVAVLGGLVTTLGAWLDLARRGVLPWTSLIDVQPPPAWLGTPIVLLEGLRTLLASILPPAATLVQQILSLPAYVVSAALLIVCWWAVYSLFGWLIWNPWDQRARDAAIREAAEAARQQAARAAAQAEIARAVE